MLNAQDLTLQVNRKTIYPVWKVDFAVAEQERVAVVGESGGGKTSLAWGLIGHPIPGQRIVAGSVLFRGTNLLNLSSAERARFYYRDMALVPQNAQNSFHPTQRMWKSAREITSRNKAGTDTLEDVMESVAAFGPPLEIPNSLWNHYPHQLSGGQKQRMAVILALLNSPQLVLLDEPSNALDELNRKTLVSFLGQWAAAKDAGLVLLTHDIGIAARWATRVVVLYRGEVVEELPAKMIEHPHHPYTQGLVNASIRLGDLPLSRSSIPGHAVPIAETPKGCGFAERCSQARSYCRKETPRLVQWGESRARCFRKS